MTFSFDTFVDDIRAAVQLPHPDDAVRAVLTDVVADPASVMQATPTDGEDEIHLFEDESVSIWQCRFWPDQVMPPHEHRLRVHIAGYAGTEKNIMFRRDTGALDYDTTRLVRSGEVISLGVDDIHAVSAVGPDPSYCLHVYMGPLTRLTRNLFDWQSGAAVPFTVEQFEQMKRPAGDLPDAW